MFATSFRILSIVTVILCKLRDWYIDIVHSGDCMLYYSQISQPVTAYMYVISAWARMWSNYINQLSPHCNRSVFMRAYRIIVHYPVTKVLCCHIMILTWQVAVRSANIFLKINCLFALRELVNISDFCQEDKSVD